MSSSPGARTPGAATPGAGTTAVGTPAAGSHDEPGARGPVLLVRPDRNDADAAALAAVGLPTLVHPFLHVTPSGDPGPGRTLCAELGQVGGGRVTWLVLTSPRTLPAWAAVAGDRELEAALGAALRGGLRVAVVGSATAATLPAGVSAHLVASRPAADALLDDLLAASDGPATALLPGSAIARPVLADGLAAAGWAVRSSAVYETAPLAHRPPAADLLHRAEVSAVLLRSPSAVAAVAAYALVAPQVTVAAVGPTTSSAARAHPWTVLALPDPDPERVAHGLAAHLRPGRRPPSTLEPSR